ncbi:MAG: cobalamin-independent methionine synthase II family protein [Candidatus Eremiobacteraeota bacterium]|nr:cobalamin-independent methionine synthase II family protein [Candidatus Eremiobacteraeota bacterium]
MTVAYRADHIGSFLRPPELLAAHKNGTPPEQLKALEDREILRVIAKQKELGYTIFTDGELRRTSFMGDFLDRVEGIDLGTASNRAWREDHLHAAGDQPLPPPVNPLGIVTGKLRQTRSLTDHELPFLKAHSPGDIKMTLPSPTQFPAILWKDGVTDKAYANHQALLDDCTAIVSNECATLAKAGIAYLQLDAPRYSYYVDPKWRDFLRTEMHAEPEELLDSAIAADNACFRAARQLQPGMTLAIHLCRGNNRSQWYAEGGYDAIAEKLFGELEVDRFLLEYDDERSGSFAPLRFVPKTKIAELGLISSKVAALESADAIVRRIDDAAKVLPLESLSISPQCGFASTMYGNMLTEDQQWAKLKLVIDVAKRVWGEV